MFGTNTVNKYKSIVLTKNENNPKLTIFSGIENTLSIGLKILNNIESNKPLNKNTSNPPVI